MAGGVRAEASLLLEARVSMVVSMLMAVEAKAMLGAAKAVAEAKAMLGEAKVVAEAKAMPGEAGTPDHGDPSGQGWKR